MTESLSERLFIESRKKLFIDELRPLPIANKQEREKSFKLDCVSVASISQRYSHANPKIGSVISPYDSKKDRTVANYFFNKGIYRLLKKTGQVLFCAKLKFISDRVEI